jgi:hypothetical protein
MSDGAKHPEAGLLDQVEGEVDVPEPGVAVIVRESGNHEVLSRHDRVLGDEQANREGVDLDRGQHSRLTVFAGPCGLDCSACQNDRDYQQTQAA